MTRIKAIIAGGLVLTILAVIGVQHLRLGIAQSRAETAEAALASCKRDRMTLVESIKDQNAAIAEMKAKADAQAERLAVHCTAAAHSCGTSSAMMRLTLTSASRRACALV